MPDEETREEPEVEGHGIPPGAAEGTSPGAEAAGTSPGVKDDDSDDVEAHIFAGTSPGGTSPGGTSPGGTSPGGTSPG